MSCKKPTREWEGHSGGPENDIHSNILLKKEEIEIVTQKCRMDLTSLEDL